VRNVTCLQRKNFPFLAISLYANHTEFSFSKKSFVTDLYI